VRWKGSSIRKAEGNATITEAQFRIKSLES
jgi:hypothetical protein